MKNSYRFFNNRDCKYFPCHATNNPDEFNCLLCFCPLYFIEECGGNHSMTEGGIKDCTNCMIPHTPKGYDHVMNVLKKRFAEVRKDNAKE